MVALAALLLVATPAVSAPDQSAGSVEYEIVVTGDGEIERGTIVWTVDDDRYAELEAAAREDGYDAVAPGLADVLAGDEPGLGGATGEDRRVEGGWELQVEFTAIDDEAYHQMNASVSDGTVSWERLDHDGGLSDADYGALTYRVVMPGAVTDTNAAEVDDDVATWHLNEADPGRLYATAETGDAGDAVPGFGVAAAILAIVGAAALWRSRS